MRTAFRASACALSLGLAFAGAPALAQPAGDLFADPEPLPEAVAQLADWVMVSGDNRDLPFAVVDKFSAQVFVFSPDGQLKGAAPALIGSAVGDDSVPGIGDRELREIAPEERTTPAGRFMSAYGPAKGKSSVLWVDYATAVSLHEVVTTERKERRLERLKSPEPDDNRITYGCINVSTRFYRKIVRPTFKDTEGVFYILPETRSLAEVFPTYRPLMASRDTALSLLGSDAAEQADARPAKRRGR